MYLRFVPSLGSVHVEVLTGGAAFDVDPRTVEVIEPAVSPRRPLGLRPDHQDPSWRLRPLVLGEAKVSALGNGAARLHECLAEPHP